MASVQQLSTFDGSSIRMLSLHISGPKACQVTPTGVQVMAATTNSKAVAPCFSARETTPSEPDLSLAKTLRMPPTHRQPAENP